MSPHIFILLFEQVQKKSIVKEFKYFQPQIIVTKLSENMGSGLMGQKSNVFRIPDPQHSRSAYTPIDPFLQGRRNYEDRKP
jgi:hypothetical protein